MATPTDLLDTLMKDCKNPEDLIGESGLLKQLTKHLTDLHYPHVIQLGVI